MRRPGLPGRWASRGALAGTAVAALLAVGGAAGAQDDPRIEQMQRQIEALQRELDALRTEMEQAKKLPPPPAPSPEASDTFAVTCPNPDCGAQLRVPAKHAGRRGRCPRCGRVFDLPPARG